MNMSTWWFDSQRALSFFFWCCVFFQLFWFGAVLVHNRVPLGPDIPGIILLYDVLLRSIYLACIYTCRVLLPLLLLLLCMSVYCCCCTSCRLLLLFVIVCRMAIFFAGSVNLTPSVVMFLFILKTRKKITNVPLGSVVAFTASICLYYVLGNYGHARSQGGRQPAGAALFFVLFSFSPSHLLSSPFYSVSLPVVTQIRGHIAGSSPPLPTTVRALHFFRERFQLILPSSTRVELLL